MQPSAAATAFGDLQFELVSPEPNPHPPPSQGGKESERERSLDLARKSGQEASGTGIHQ